MTSTRYVLLVCVSRTHSVHVSDATSVASSMEERSPPPLAPEGPPCSASRCAEDAGLEKVDDAVRGLSASRPAWVWWDPMGPWDVSSGRVDDASAVLGRGESV